MSRSAFWREAGKVFEDRKADGTGAGTFGIARLRYRKSEQVSRHAHGFVPQTLADLGLLGLGVTLFLLVAWLWAVLRATRLLPRRRRSGERRDWTQERIALVALLLGEAAGGARAAHA